VAAPEGLRTDPATSARLGRIRQKDTKPEQIVRAILSSFGVHYRLRNRDLPGSPDIANRARRWVIFVHGCFWHAHAGCRRATTPKRNKEFWVTKFNANRTRDARAVLALERSNYRVLVVWECETAGDEDALRRTIRSFLGAVGRSPWP
jgi:DNA mismatch endonuclease Vsr